MFLENYRQIKNNKTTINRQQGSEFAKNVAGDFNPIHDTDAKRFCVPGDLLFACAIEKYGISKSMCFTFSGMVGDGIDLNFPTTDDENIDITDDNKKKYLSIQRKGENITSGDILKDLTCQYVQFSGQTFPHILVPLMEQHKVMINPARPLVIYERMSIELDTLIFETPQLDITNSTLNVSGKRGDVTLEFSLKSNGSIIGKGKKTMVLSGLRDYNADDINTLIERYQAAKSSYTSA